MMNLTDDLLRAAESGIPAIATGCRCVSRTAGRQRSLADGGHRGPGRVPPVGADGV